MQLLNQLFSILLLFVAALLFNSCGDHSEPEVTDSSNTTPTINLTTGPYVVVVNKDLIVGVETKFASKEPVYSAVPSPVGIAIVNQILPGQIYVTGVKAGTTSLTISDLANPKATAKTISVTVKEAPKLTVKPATLSGQVNQVILLEISTSNQEATPVYKITIADTSIANILDKVNNPNLIDLLKAGETTVIIEDTANGAREELLLTVTN